MITSRDQATADRAADRLRSSVPGADVCGLTLDLSSMQAVRAFSERFIIGHQSLHILICNAAALPKGRGRVLTADGYEMTFATNHLGHFLLTECLTPLLRHAATQAGEARIIVVSSRLHIPGTLGVQTRFDFEDVHLQNGYSPMLAYKNSKLANMWFAYELNRRLQGSGITINALCPGFVPATMAENARGLERFIARYLLPHIPIAHTLDEATDTYTYVATDPVLKGIGGRFYGESRLIPSSPESYNVEKARRLWQLSEELTA